VRRHTINAKKRGDPHTQIEGVVRGGQGNQKGKNDKSRQEEKEKKQGMKQSAKTEAEPEASRGEGTMYLADEIA